MVAHIARRADGVSADSVLLIYWEDVVSIRNQPLTEETAEARRSFRVSAGILAFVDADKLALVMDTELPHTGEGQWEIYPRKVVHQIIHVRTGKRINWQALPKYVADLSSSGSG